MRDRSLIARDASARDLYTRAVQPNDRLLAQAERERLLRVFESKLVETIERLRAEDGRSDLHQRDGGQPRQPEARHSE